MIMDVFLVVAHNVLTVWNHSYMIGMSNWTSYGSYTLGGCLTKICTVYFCLIWWFLISVQSRTVGWFYLVMSLLYVESLLKQHLQSPLCVCKLSECYFLQAVDWAVSVMCLRYVWLASCVVGYLLNMMFILSLSMWTLDPIFFYTLTPHFLHNNFSIAFLMVPILTSNLFSD